MPHTLIFELDGVRVTSAIVHVGESSYQVANIGGVRVTQFKKYNRVSILTLLLGAALISVSAILDGRTVPEIGFSLVEIGAAAMLLARDRDHHGVIVRARKTSCKAASSRRNANRRSPNYDLDRRRAHRLPVSHRLGART
jgi:hypothetical protein